MAQVTTLGVDIAKNGVCAQGIDTQGHVIVKKRLARQKVLPFVTQLPPCLIGMEASGGAHYWGMRTKSSRKSLGPLTICFRLCCSTSR